MKVGNIDEDSEIIVQLSRIQWLQMKYFRLNPNPRKKETYHPENEQSFDTCLPVPNYM